MTITRWTLEEVAAWGPRWPTLGRSEDFLRPHPDIWPRDVVRIPGLIDDILSSLAAADQLRFSQAVLASLALSPRDRELTSLLHPCLDPAALGLPFSLEELLAMDWIRVPTLLADSRRGVMRSVLLGRGERGNRFPTGRMDRAAAEAVELALDLAGLPEAYVWPMVDPHILGPALHGDSLALPVGLGAWLLRRKHVWPEGLVCTGGLAGDGRITPVDNVPVKARVAANMGFRALLHPERAFDPNEPACPVSLVCAGVRTLDEAQALAACFHPDHAPDMIALYRRRRDPARVADAVYSVPPAFLDWLSEAEPDFRETLATAYLCPESATPLLDRLHARMADRSTPLTEISRLAQRLFPFDVWRTKALETPGIGMAVARLHVEAANHQGLLHEFAAWEPVLRQACARLFALRDARADELLAAIHLLVGGLHNRYAFSAADLEEQVRPLAGLLEELEGDRQRRRRRIPNACCASLGRYHGTLAQHYGFCGPEHLEEVERHVRSAQEAFGRGTVPDYRADWRRGFSYLLHALLDAGELQSVREHLEAYLDRPLNALDFTALNPFEHFHLAKFLAFTGEDMPDYPDWASANLADATPDHPWPLWALNLGKAATNREDKIRFLRASLRLCRAAPGPTVRAMALLPLAWLDQAGLMERNQVAKMAEDVVEEIRTSGLDREHFAMLLDETGSEILECVRECEARLFPFGYR